jgi:hypothetical protein
MAETHAIVIGLLAAHDDRDLAEALAEDLPAALREHVGPGTDWDTEVHEVDPADASVSSSELVDAVRRRLLDRKWQLGIGLTTLPLRVARRPVATSTSVSHGVALVSVPALGAVHRRHRLRDVAVEIVAGLLGEADAAGDGRRARMAARSAELASPASGDAEDDGTLRFAGSVVRGNLRLLVGMIAANRPTQVMVRLSRAATAALGTGAYALSSSNIWTLADVSSWPRLLAVALLSVALILVALVVAHGLWERARDPAARERVALFNVVTVATLAIGVVTLYLALFVMMTLAAVVVIPPSAFAHAVGHDPSAGDMVRLGWLVSSIATVGGALGSLLESDAAVREATYRPHAPAGRSEAAHDDRAVSG